MPMAVFKLLVLNVVVCRAITITTVQTCFTVVRVFGCTKVVQLSILTSVMESSTVFCSLELYAELLCAQWNSIVKSAFPVIWVRVILIYMEISQLLARQRQLE